MKTAIIIRIGNDPIRLELCLSYYSRYFDEIYVYECNSPKGIFGDLYKKYSYTPIPTVFEPTEPYVFSLMCNKQKELLLNNDWTLCADADEFIIPDPKIYKDLRDYMERINEKQPFCTGYEICMAEGEKKIDYSQPVFKQRKYWVRDITGSYNKPILTRILNEWVLGFHKLVGMSDEKIRAYPKTDLYLVHTKWIDVLKGSPSYKDETVEKIPEKIRRVV